MFKAFLSLWLQKYQLSPGQSCLLPFFITSFCRKQVSGLDLLSLLFLSLHCKTSIPALLCLTLFIHSLTDIYWAYIHLLETVSGTRNKTVNKVRHDFFSFSNSVWDNCQVIHLYWTHILQFVKKWNRCKVQCS